MLCRGTHSRRGRRLLRRRFGFGTEHDQFGCGIDQCRVLQGAAAPADPAVTKEITEAYTTFFNGKAPAADRTKLIENSEGFAQVLQGMAADPQAQGTTVTVKGVTLTDDTNADVTYDLLLNGTPALPDQTGQAVKVDGTWRVATATFCALLSIQGKGDAIPACS